MKIFESLHAFIWESMTVNNCNTYFIDGPTRILIDPGHLSYFNHVKTGLADLSVSLEDTVSHRRRRVTIVHTISFISGIVV